MRRSTPYFFFLCFGLLSAFSLRSSWAQRDANLREEVLQLKSAVENANVKLADAMNQLTSIQQQFASMRGHMESGGHFYEEQRRTLLDYDQRLAALEDKISLLTSLLRDIKEGRLTEKSQAANEAETREFQRLLDLVQAEDFAKAGAGFQAFLQKNPRSPLADGAQFWLAESSYGLRDYKKAITEYQGLIQKYPSSPRVKTAVLKQGYSFFGLKMYPESRAFFEKVTATYPNTSEAAKASAKLKEVERLLAVSPTPAAPPSSAPETAPSASPPLQTITKPYPSSLPPAPTTTPAPKPAPKPAPGGFYD